ncbi:MAG: hypothetical protein ACN4G0_08310 [Polyangiales bacterium]
MRRTWMSSCLLAAFAVGAFGCSSDGGGSNGGPNETVEDVLTDFGVDIADSPRVDNDGDPLGDDYSPFGTMTTINKYSELMLFGARLDDSFASTNKQPVFDLVPDDGNTFTPDLLDDSAAGEESWFSSADLARDAVAADFDGDGVDETVIVHQIPNESALLQVYQDQAEGFSIGASKVVATQAVDQVVLAAGDFDGDVDEDLVIALISNLGIEVTLWENNGGELESTGTSFTVPMSATNPGSVHLILKSGNIDRDNGIELAAMLNETSVSGPTSRYFVYDDAGEGFGELDSGPATVTLPSESVTAVSGDIALGDVDGDGMDEVVYGGLSAVGNACNLNAFSVTQVLDDARHDLAPLAANKVGFSDTRQPCSSGASHSMNYHPITLPDLDGDRVAEIHSFEFIYANLAASPGVFTELYRIPQENLLTMGTSGSDYRFNHETISFATGDVTSDGRDNIVFYSQIADPGEQGIQVWGLDQIDGWKQFEFFGTDFENSGSPLRAKMLLPDVDLDQDSMSLEYDNGSYRLLFTEPIVLAALAAAPCSPDTGPAVDDACRTAFGKAVSDTEERTDSWSIIAGVSVGYEAEFSALGVKVGSAEAILNTRNEGRFYGGDAYTLTTQVVRETGVLEDSVIFSTVPFDVYTYRILSHPNPELIGGEVQVRLPRSPITIMATREFYNENIAEDGIPIDERIFEHTAGDPLSYPTVAEKDQLLRTYDGLESDQVDVGQGSGFTQVQISEFNETIDGKEYSFEATLDLKATKGGIVGGLSIGGGAGFDISTRRGEETIYQGTVANVAAANFPQDAFSFGLFAYIVDDSANPQPFEVLNYWVVPPPN